MTFDRGWRTVVCCASGPSIDAAQGEVVRQAREADRCRVIAINDTWRLVPFSDVLYACDKSWWRVHINSVRAGFSGECWTQSDEAAKEHGLHHVVGEKGDALSAKPDTIQHGGNSGFQAIQLARLFGAKRVALVGYDMQRTGGRAHFFGDHPRSLTQGDPKSWVRNFDVLAIALKNLGVDVVNCSQATALTCFRRAELSAELA